MTFTIFVYIRALSINANSGFICILDKENTFTLSDWNKKCKPVKTISIYDICILYVFNIYFRTVIVKDIKSTKQTAASSNDGIQHVIYQVDNKFENLQHSEYLPILI